MQGRFSRGRSGGQSALASPGALRYASVMGIISSLLLLASAQVAAEPLPAEIHNFGDWVVTCDNGLRCEAVSLAPDKVPTLVGEEPAANQEDLNSWDVFGVMRMEREPAAAAPLVITVSDFEGVPAKLLQYGEALDVRFERAGEDEWRVVAASQRDFLDRFFTDPLVLQDAAGKTLAWFATPGARGAVTYMEERQGRLRTPSSVTRFGRRPLSVIPAPPAVPVVQVAARTTERPLMIPKRRLEAARREFGCTQEEIGAASADESLAALGGGRTLILMGCGAGAYNYNSLVLIATREGNAIRIVPARFDVTRDPIEGEPDPKGFFVTNAGFDPATMSISEWAKGRGLGDCGTAATYAWDGQSFRLVEQNEMSECRGTLELLTTWRAQAR
jgi:hypothetical protein